MPSLSTTRPRSVQAERKQWRASSTCCSSARPGRTAAPCRRDGGYYTSTAGGAGLVELLPEALPVAEQAKIREALGIQSKRQKIVEAYRLKAQRIVDNADRDLVTMKLSDETARGFVGGFQDALGKTRLQMGELFTRRLNAETAKSRFLNFMLENFQDYKLSGKSIDFTTQQEIQQYTALAKAVTVSQKQLEEFAAKLVQTVDDGQEQLKKFVR
jgi:hypothetical protein